MLKGSYEDTQTSALGTASALRFHYLAAQEAELSGRLKVGLWVLTLELSRQPSLGPAPAAAGLSCPPLRPCEPPRVRHMSWADRRILRACGGCGEL